MSSASSISASITQFPSTSLILKVEADGLSIIMFPSSQTFSETPIFAKFESPVTEIPPSLNVTPSIAKFPPKLMSPAMFKSPAMFTSPPTQRFLCTFASVPKATT